MKYRVFLCETIGSYGLKEWHEDYDTVNEALKRIEYCRKNGKLGTDWFIRAKEKIEEVQ